MKLRVSNWAVIAIAAAAEGAALILYASYSRVLISTHFFDLTTDEFGLVFLPELLTLIATAALAARIGRRIPTKQVFPLGLGCSLVSMVLLFASAAPAIHVADYPVLLASSAFLGAGFGMAIPALITYAVILTRRPERSVLAVNALLAAGAAAPPTLALAFTDVPFWWGPAILSAVLALPLAASRRLPATRAVDAAMQPFAPRVPGRVKLYQSLIILYGLCAVTGVAWSQPHTFGPVHQYLTFKVLVLGAFWAALMLAARVLFAVLDQLPIAGMAGVGLLAFVVGMEVTALIVRDYALARIAIWLLAALACAAVLPIRSRTGREDLTTISVALAGGIAILYPLGLGLARASLTTMLHVGLSLLTLFGILGVLGAAASVLLLRVLAPRNPDLHLRKRPAEPLVTGVMMAQEPGPVVPVGLMKRRPPDLAAAGGVARHLDVATAGVTAGRAVTWRPCDGHRSRPPGMMAPAFLGKARPQEVASLFHQIIQT